MEKLETRQLMAVLSSPSEPLATIDSPRSIALGTFNQDASVDVLAFNSTGEATFAENGGNDRFEPVTNLSGVTDAVQTTVPRRLDADPFTDLIVASAEQISVLHNDGTGNFDTVQTFGAASSGAFESPLSVANTLAVEFVDADPFADLVTAVPGEDAVQVFSGQQGGTFADPITYQTGQSQPTTVAVADLVGDALPDVIVGHADGSIVFFEGTTSSGQPALIRRDDLTLVEQDSVSDLVAADLDDDGQTDLVVTTTSSAFALFSSEDPQANSAIINGDFSSGLTGYTQEIIGHPAGGSPGSISGLGGVAQLSENDSFLTSLQQSLVIPEGATALTFDLLSLGLDPVAGGIPDAFEVSLLGENGQSVVPTHSPTSTAFFNVSSGSNSSLGSGVSVDGNTVTLDVSSLTAGTTATLFFDLIGNVPGRSSTVSIDNVRLNPEQVFSDQLTRLDLPGNYGQVVDAEVGDVDGDGNLDVLLSSQATRTIAVFNGDGNRVFAENTISLTQFATAPGEIALAPLTANDSVDDLIVVLPEENLVLSPLGADVTSPLVTLLNPVDTAEPLETFDGTFTLGFSEPVRESGLGAVTNLDAYELLGEGADGVLGTTDDISIPLESVAFDTQTMVASVDVASEALPLADGAYRLVISGADPETAIRDLAGNALGGQNDVTFDFQVDAPLSIGSIDLPAVFEGTTATITVPFSDPGRVGGYQSVIDWGDGTQSIGLISLDATGFAGVVSASHVYADDGDYPIRVTVLDEASGMNVAVTTASVTGLAPVVTASEDRAAVTGQPTLFTVASFSDLGFSNLVAGTEETFSVTIDWGDGTPILTAPSVNLANGSVGIATSGVVSAEHAFAQPGVFVVTITVTDDDGLFATDSFSVEVTDLSSHGACLPSIDFDRDITGNALTAGTVITDQWALWGIQVTTDNPVNHPAILFDSTNPTGGDFDLGGPYGNVLIISEDGDTSDPDDNASGGSLIFDFDQPTRLDEITLLDIDADETSTITLFNELGEVIRSITTAGLGNNLLQTITIDAPFVSRMEIALSGSGALAELVFCRDLPTVMLSGDSVAVEGAPYALTGLSPDLNLTSWQLGFADGTTQTLFGDSPATTFVFPDGPGQTTVFGWATDGNNVYRVEPFSLEVENVALTLSINGDSTIRALNPYTLQLSSEDPGDDTITTWTVDWGDGTIESFDGNPASVTHRYLTAGTYTISATATDEDASATSNLIDVEVLSSGSLALPRIDFSRDAAGVPLSAGDRITDQFAALGFTVSTNNPYMPAMIFDSSHPTGGDRDLGTPNNRFGGPGRGRGGVSNDTPLGNVLIISEDNDSSDPDDNAGGGVLIFDFDAPAMIQGIGLLDVQSGDNRIDLFNAQGNLISSTPIPNLGNNGFGRVELDALDVARLEVIFAGGGAITDIEFANDAPVIPAASTRFFVVDRNDDAVFRYSSAGDSLGQFSVSEAFNPRGITTTGEGNPIWVISEEGRNERVYVYDSDGETLLGSWTARGLTSPEGIATDGTDIWIVDRATNQVRRYAGAATRLSGSQTADEVFDLDSDNQDPRGLTTDGERFWVVDTDDNRVYIYDIAGNLINQWDLDGDNGSPRGITIDPSGGDGVWVVDRSDDAVFFYPNAIFENGQTQSAQSVFELASGNNHPEGIADPVMTINLGDRVVDRSLAPSQVDEWLFDASQGTGIFVDFLSLSGGAANVTITSPSGQILFNRNSSLANSLDSGRLSLSETGAYSIRVTSNASVTYSFELNEVVDAPTRPIQLGEVVADAFDPIGQIDTFSFSADAGTRIYIDRLSSSGGTAQLQLTTPDGNNLFSSSTSLFADGRSTVDLDETGQYLLTLTYLSGDPAGGYEFQINDVTQVPSETILLDEIVESNIGVAGQQREFTFDVAGPTDIVLDAITSPSGRTWAVQDSAGNELFRDLIVRDSLKISLPDAGTYTLVALATDDGVGPFSFRVWDSTDLGPLPIELNQTRSRNLAPQQTITYQVDLVAGQEILFDVQQNASSIASVAFASAFTFTSPGGTDLFSGVAVDQGLFTVPETGTYTLVAAPFNDGFRDLSGEITWRLQEAVTPATSTVTDTSGGEFYLAAPNGFFAEIMPRLVISSPVDTQVVIDLPGLGWLHATDVVAGETVVIDLPQDILLDRFSREITEFSGIHVVADAEVSVYTLLDGFASGDAITGLPVDALGTEYLVETFPATCPLGCQPSEISIVATQDNTIVTITPTANAGDFATPRLAGQSYDIFLDAGQTYQLRGGGFTAGPGATPIGLSGTEVISNQPIALFGGNPETFVPDVPAADILVQQIPPLSAWGTRYVSVPLANRVGGDTFRVLASADQTDVLINGQLVATLNRGEHFQTIIDGPAEFTADAPVLVTRFAHGGEFDSPGAPEVPDVTTGDPFMLTLVPTEQFDTDFIVESFSEGINEHFLSITTFTSGIADVVVDGQPLSPDEFVPIGDGTFSAATLSVAEGTHRITTGQPASVEVYGYGNFDSYGYYGGSRLSPVGRLASLTLDPVVATLLPSAPHTVTATVTDDTGAPLADVRVDFSVFGTVTTTSQAFSGPDGLVSFTYTSDDFGTDTITATVGSITATATADRLGQPPTITVNSPVSGAAVSAGVSAIVSGRALPGPTQAEIVAVTINGRRVDAFDPAGNFFASVIPIEGVNQYELIATDSLGQTATATLSLTGQVIAGGTFDLSTTIDTTVAGDLEFSGTTFNRATNVLHTTASLTAVSPAGLALASSVVFDPITPLRVDVESPDSRTAGGQPVVSFVDTIPATGLATGQSSELRQISFSNPQRDRFDFQYQIVSSENRAPVIESAPPVRAIINQRFEYSIIASDPDQDLLTYSLLSGPATATLDENGVLTWIPTQSDRGHHDLLIQVSDGRGGVTQQSFTLVAGDPLPNGAPVFTSQPPARIESGADFLFTATADDPDGDTVTFSLPTAPASATIDPNSGLISLIGSPDGNFPFVVRASDRSGAFSELSFSLTVGTGSANAVPEWVGDFATTAIVDSLYVEFPTATDADGDLLTFNLLSAPAGATITTLSAAGDDARARIEYRPTVDDLGPQPFLVEVTDGNGGSATRSFTLQVSPVPEPVAPVFESEPNRIATADQPFQYAPIAVDPDGTSSDLVYTRLAGPAGLQIDPVTGVVTFVPAAGQIGDQQVTIQVTDADGLTATQSWTLSVRPANVAPEIVSSPLTTVSAGARYRYDVIAIDADDNVTYQLVDGPVGATLSTNSGFLFWRPQLSDIGDHTITVRATDDRGLFSEQSYTLSVTADITPPIAEVVVTDSPILIGGSTRIMVRASDDVAVQNLQLTIDGEVVPIDSQNGFTFVATEAAVPDVVLTATDTSGNISTATLNPELRVLDPSDTTPPEIAFSSPAPGDVVTYLTDIVGSVTDDNLEFYELQVSLSGANEFRTVSRVNFRPGPGGAGVVDDVLGVFDPTNLANDFYDIRVFARDVSGNVSTLTTPLAVEGEAKLGNFRIEQTDLSVPLAGIPIQINRVYDTLDASFSGDFGFGSRLDVASPRIRESVPVSQAEAAGAGIFGANAFRIGSRVYLNAPDGRRVGFTFDPVPEPQLLGTLWRPRFVADPGVYHTLEVEDIALQQNDDGSFGLYLLGFAYNPDTYTLTTPDQLRYTYNQFDDIQLQSIQDRNNVTLTVDEDGIRSSTGAQITWTRDDQGRITEILDPAGNTLTYTYTTAGELASFTDQSGSVTTYSYLTEPAHYLESITDPRGNQTLSLEYDESGRLTGQGDALGNNTTQQYDLENNSFTTTDRLGNPTTIVFDERGNVTSATDPLGGTFTRVYDENDNEIRVTDANGITTEFTYDDQGNVTSIIEVDRTTTIEYNDNNDILRIVGPVPTDAIPGFVPSTVTLSYDAAGNLASFTNGEGETETFVNDEQGRPISIVDARGNEQQLEYGEFDAPDVIRFADGSERRTTRDPRGLILTATNEAGEVVQFGYDAVGRPTSVTDGVGNVYQNIFQDELIVSTIDPLGRETTFEYDERNRLVTVTDALGGAVTRSYDANDRLVSTTNQVGQTETFVYDARGDLSSFIDSAGFATNFTYDDLSNLLSIEDARGFVTSYDYDERNRLISETDAEGNVESYGYDHFDNLISVTDRNGGITRFEYDNVSRLVSSTNALGGVQRFGYDAAGNNTAFFDELGNETRFEYDIRDRLIRQIDAEGFESLFEYDAASRLVRATDQEGFSSSFQYDSNNRLVSQTDHLGGTERFEYDEVGNLVNSIDQLGRATTRSYDALDRVFASIDPSGARTEFEYDAIGNLLGLTDPIGNTTSYEYDQRNLITSETDPLGSQSFFVYDEVGNLTRSIDRLERITDFSYDGLNRLVTESWLSPAGVLLQTYDYSYDAVGNLLTADGPQVGYQYTYDLLNRVVSETSIDPTVLSGFTLNYQYDAASNLTEIQDSLGVTVSQTYDPRNLLSSIVWTGGGIDNARVNYGYDGRGFLTQVERFSDATGTRLVSSSSQAFDSLGRLTAIEHLGAIGNEVASYQFSFDAASQLTQQVINGEVTDYQLDELGQLVSSTNTDRPDESFVYDDNGNRLGENTIIGAGNQLLADEFFTYDYDAAGNLIQRTELSTGEVTQFEYDHRNRLTLAVRTSAGGIELSRSEFQYDVFDRLVTRTVDSDGVGGQAPNIRHTIYNGENAWLDFDSQGSITARYLFGPGLDQNIARYRTGEGTAWYLTDQLGSIRDILDSDGNVINSIQYDSFGNILSETNTAAGDRFKFTGREFEAELGLYYYRARFYDPGSGRFISQDPIGFFGGDPNLYGYVSNRPQEFVDPTGNIAVPAAAILLDLRLASAVTTATLDYACGFLGAHFRGSDSPEIEATATAAVGFALGYALDGAATTRRAALFAAVGGAISTALQISSGQFSGVALVVDTACFGFSTILGGRSAARRFVAPRGLLDALPSTAFPGNATANITRQQFRNFKEAVEALGFKVKRNGNLRRPDGSLLQGTTDPTRRLVRINSRHATQQALVDEFVHVFNSTRGRGRFLDDVEAAQHLFLEQRVLQSGTRGLTELQNIRFHQLELKNFLLSGEKFPSFFDGITESIIRGFTQ